MVQTSAMSADLSHGPNFKSTHCPELDSWIISWIDDEESTIEARNQAFCFQFSPPNDLTCLLIEVYFEIYNRCQKLGFRL